MTRITPASMSAPLCARNLRLSLTIASTFWATRIALSLWRLAAALERGCRASASPGTDAPDVGACYASVGDNQALPTNLGLAKPRAAALL
jgi:hypothetical protein